MSYSLPCATHFDSLMIRRKVAEGGAQQITTASTECPDAQTQTQTTASGHLSGRLHKAKERSYSDPT